MGVVTQRPACIFDMRVHREKRCVLEVCSGIGYMSAVNENKQRWCPKETVVPFSMCFPLLLVAAVQLCCEVKESRSMQSCQRMKFRLNYLQALTAPFCHGTMQPREKHTESKKCTSGN
eukprot:936841-Amphidinium_carterae.1